MKSLLRNALKFYQLSQNLIIPAVSSRVPIAKYLKEKIRFWKKHFGIHGSNGFTLHTNGCGDFTLLSKSAWHALRGYPEFKAFSFHIDSIFCHQAHESGFFEHVFPDALVHYHIDHSDGWTPETNDQLLARLRKHNIPFIESQFDVLVDVCRRTKKPLFNRSDWGLIGNLLKERFV